MCDRVVKKFISRHIMIYVIQITIVTFKFKGSKGPVFLEWQSLEKGLMLSNFLEKFVEVSTLLLSASMLVPLVSS